MGVWKKALSDVWLTTRFSFQIALYLLVKQKENLTLHQVSIIRTLFCTPFQLTKETYFFYTCLFYKHVSIVV